MKAGEAADPSETHLLDAQSVCYRDPENTLESADQAAGGGQEETQQLWKTLGGSALNSLQAESDSIICNPSRE